METLNDQQKEIISTAYHYMVNDLIFMQQLEREEFPIHVQRWIDNLQNEVLEFEKCFTFLTE